MTLNIWECHYKFEETYNYELLKKKSNHFWKQVSIWRIQWHKKKTEGNHESFIEDYWIKVNIWANYKKTKP